MIAGGKSNVLVVVLICVLFGTFQLLMGTGELHSGGMGSVVRPEPENHRSNDRVRVKKVFNPDASLSVPFLDKINKYWHIGGTAEVRNMKSIMLTSAGQSGKHGVVLSNGIGDNTITDFEIVVDFRIYGREQRQSSHIGDGMAIVITPENGFLVRDLVSSFSRKQYEINSGGVHAKNVDLMGLPNNLPGLALVFDTYKNNYRTDVEIPYLDLILNTDPQKDMYSVNTDNLESTSKKLTPKHIKLHPSTIKGDITKLRIIYSETIGFLKVDIQYQKEGDYWIELYQSNEKIYLPKNKSSGQRFIGISALTGDATENVEILAVSTNEYHWNSYEREIQDSTTNDNLPRSYEYAQALKNYLLNEFGHRIALEKDDYTRWKMKMAQPNYENDLNDRVENQHVNNNKHQSKSSSRYIILLLFLVLIYISSVYIRVTKKHLRRLKRRRATSQTLLPT